MESPWRQWWRVGGAFGIGFAALFVIGAIIIQGEPPMRDDSIQEIRKYFADDGTKYLVGDYMTSIGFVLFFLPYLVTLRWVLGSGEGWPPIWSWLTVVGGLIMVALGGAGAMAFGTLAISADNKEIDDSSIRLFMEMNSYAFNLFSFGMALFVGSASVVILRTRVLWRWLPLLGFVAAILLVSGASWPIDGDENGPLAVPGFIGAILTLLFVILSSINLLVLKEEPSSTERAEPRSPMASPAG
jgi:hypothetical protein